MSASVSTFPGLGLRPAHTNLVKHLIALVQHENADAAEAQDLIAHKGVQAARGAHDDVGARVLVLDRLNVLLDGGAAVEDARLDVGHVLAEAVVLVADLERQLAGVAHDQDGHLAVDGLDLLERRQGEDSRLSETRLGLADDVASEESLGDTGLLNCGPIDVRLFPESVSKNSRCARKVRPSTQRSVVWQGGQAQRHEKTEVKRRAGDGRQNRRNRLVSARIEAGMAWADSGSSPSKGRATRHSEQSSS